MEVSEWSFLENINNVEPSLYMHWGNILTQKKKCILFTTLHELSFSSKLPCSYCTLRLLTQAILSWAQSKFNISVGVRVKGRLQAYIAVRCKVQQ